MCVICFPKALSTLSSYKVKMRICTLKLEEERGIKFRTNASYRLEKSNGLIQTNKAQFYMWSNLQSSSQLLWGRSSLESNLENGHWHRKQTYGYQKGKRGRDKIGVWNSQKHTAMYKIDKQGFSTGNSIQYLAITYNEKESE